MYVMSLSSTQEEVTHSTELPDVNLGKKKNKAQRRRVCREYLRVTYGLHGTCILELQGAEGLPG